MTQHASSSVTPGIFCMTYMSVMFSISASDCSIGKATILRSASTHEIRTPVHVQGSGQAVPGLQSASSIRTQLSPQPDMPKPIDSRLIPGSSPPDLRPLESDAWRQRKTLAPASGASERETRKTDRKTQSTLSRASIYAKCSYSSPPLASVRLALPRMMLAFNDASG